MSRLDSKIDVILRKILVFFTCYLILILIYRLWFCYDLTKLYFLKYAQYKVWCAYGIINDLLVGLVFVVLLMMMRFIIKSKLYYVIDTLLLLILTLSAALFVAHKKLFTLQVIGLSYHALLGFMQDKLTFITMNMSSLSYLDWLYAGMPIIMYGMLCLINFRYCLDILIYCLLPVTFIIISISSLIVIISDIDNENAWVKIIINNPIQFLAKDYWTSKNNSYVLKKGLPGVSQVHTVKLIDSLFIDNDLITPQIIKVNLNQKLNLNVVIFVLESVGLQYVFDTSHDNAVPMPFLKSLSKKGVWYTNNYSVGNVSYVGGFGLLTGMYGNPMPVHFEMRDDIRIPSIASWIGKHYHSNFMLCGNMEYFFMRGLIKHSFNNVYNFKVYADQKIISTDNLISETTGFKYFLSALKYQTTPFISIYWSEAAHFPYHDYGSLYHIGARSDLAINKYLNNLRLLDDEIKACYEMLQREQLLDNTLFIIVGDHGEGFGQHYGSWMHATTLNEEQIKVPLLLYQPKLLKPQVITQLTSSIDILPTILDLLKITYDENQIQGESMLKSHKQRKYIFMYGEENELASINQFGNKMIINFSKGTCSQYNLKDDAKELFPNTCSFPEQENAMIAFRHYQSEMLRWKNNEFKYKIAVN